MTENLKSPPPPIGRVVVGFDLGERHVGVAIRDEIDRPARPFDTLEVTPRTLVAKLADVARRCEASLIVVGLPLRLDGREGLASRAARRAARSLARETGIPVDLQDERMTTAQVHTHRKLALHKGRSGVDARAAAVILQTYLDRRTNGPCPPHDESE